MALIQMKAFEDIGGIDLTSLLPLFLREAVLVTREPGWFTTALVFLPDEPAVTFTGSGFTYPDEAGAGPVTGRLGAFAIEDGEFLLVAENLDLSAARFTEIAQGPTVWSEIYDFLLKGDDRVVGTTQSDVIDGGRGEDHVSGARGSDTLLGSFGEDLLQGERGDDLLRGGGRDDRLQGGLGEDRLWGGAGSDALDGGRGRDVLHGGSGSDSFVFGTRNDPLLDLDRIEDFDGAEDTLRLDDAVFVGLDATGALGGGRFALATDAPSDTDRIIYDQATGRLWFDADGAGDQPRALFARLDPGTALFASDILVF